jgi:hypothetical protein
MKKGMSERDRLPGTAGAKEIPNEPADGFFRNLRRFLGRFPGFLSPEHSERALGLYLLGVEMN